MSAASEQASGSKKGVQMANDVYTAILGLAGLVLTATVVFVCLRGQDLYATIFRIVEAQ